MDDYSRGLSGLKDILVCSFKLPVNNGWEWSSGVHVFNVQISIKLSHQVRF